MDSGPSWLCPTPFDRERLIDMERKLARPRAVMYACVGAAFLSAIPWFGLWILAPLVWSFGFYFLARRWIARSARPEWPVAAVVVNAQLMLGVGIALSGGPQSPALPFLVLVVMILPARFTSRGVIAGIVISIAVLLVSAVGSDPAGYIDDPTYVNSSLACLLGVGVLSQMLMRSEVHQRTRAVLDPLTGLLNREALSDRFAELAEQAALTGG